TRPTDAVPTAAIRGGNFASLPVTIYDPSTGNPDGSGRAPFAGNLIPANRINSVSNKIQSLAPLPNQAGTSQGTLNNYFSSGTEKLNRYNYDVKVNWNPTSSLAVWGKYSRMDASVGSKFVFGEDLGGPGLSRAGAPEVSSVGVNIPTFGYTKTFSPTFLLDGTIAITRMDNAGIYPGYGKKTGTDLWGIPNTNDPVVTGPAPERVKAACPALANGNCFSGMPTLSTGFTQWGRDSRVAAILLQRTVPHLHDECHEIKRTA